jgi:hypothetical protein
MEARWQGSVGFKANEAIEVLLLCALESQCSFRVHEMADGA